MLRGGIQKWFDLRDFDAKIERFKSAQDGVHLRLKVKDVNQFKQHAANIIRAGWTASLDDDTVFINKQKINTMSEIKRALNAFWPDVLKFPLEDLNKLPVTVHTGVYVRENVSDNNSITQNVDLGLLPDDVQKSIMNRIFVAASKISANKYVTRPFDGKILKVYNDAFNRYGTEGVLALGYALRSFVDGDLGSYEKYSSSLINGLKSGSDLPPDTVKTFTTVAEKMNKYASNICITENELKKYRATNFLALCKKYSIPCTWLDYETVKEEVNNDSIPKNICGIPISYDAGLSNELRWQSAKRIEKALSWIQKNFNLLTDNEIIERKRLSIKVLHNFSGSENNDDIGGMVQINNSAILLEFSPFSLRELIHEIGHVVDRLYFSQESREDKYNRILKDTGVLDAVEKDFEYRIRRSPEFLKEYSSEQIKYLKDPAEIFARTFENAVVLQAKRNGDVYLSEFGGGFLEVLNFTAEQPQILEAFIDKVKTWNNEYSAEIINVKNYDFSLN